MRSTFRVLFYTKNQAIKNGRVPVMGRITVNGTTASFSCKRDVPLALWDAKGNCAKGKSEEARRLNRELENIKAQIGKHYQYLSDHDSFLTAKKVYDRYNGFGEEIHSLMEIFNIQIRDYKRQIGKTKAQSTYRGLVDEYKCLSCYLKDKLGTEDIPLMSLDMDFIKNYTMSGWVKMPNYRLNLPDYSDRAIFEGLVNHLIHRDYTVMGGEVHIDIYDDRVELVSPGAMLDGTQIQDRDIYNVPSIRRNPVIADMFTQLDYMEKRGSGLRKMRELTEKLPNFLPGKEPRYKTEASSFFTTFYNLNWGENGRIPVEEVADRVNSILKKYSVNGEGSEKKFGVNAEKFGVNEKSSEKTFGDSQKSSVKTFGDFQKSSVKQKRLGRTAQSILDLVISDGSISQDKMAEKIGVSKRAIEMQIANLKAKGLLVREGADHGGYWRIIVKP